MLHSLILKSLHYNWLLPSVVVVVTVVVVVVTVGVAVVVEVVGVVFANAAIKLKVFDFDSKISNFNYLNIIDGMQK